MFDAELAELRAVLTSQGAPDEALRVLDEAADVEDALQRLQAAGFVSSPEDALAGVLDGFTPLLERGCDQLDAELAGLEFLRLVRDGVPEEEVPAVLVDLVAHAEQSGTPQALAMLRVLAVTGPAEEVRVAAAEAADRLAAGGLKDRPWVRGLGSPEVGSCFGYGLGPQSAIALTFTYGRKAHAVVVLIDHVLGGGVKDCFVTDSPDTIRAEYRTAARQIRADFLDYTPAEARVILDEALASEPCPVEEDQVDDVDTYLDLLHDRVALLPGGGPVETTAGVHRLKITLRGSKPPIWRRLEVPSDITLEELHRVVQTAFGWEDYHLWVFETRSGDYGMADPELGHRSAAARKLQDVAAGAGARIRYRYDFGDDWAHEVLVEDVLVAEPGVDYPRVVAGRRAGPPEDCGGIWGYQNLLLVLADPEHEQHRFLVEWLGLDSADEFDPAAFDLDAVNRELGSTGRPRRRAKS